MSDKYQEIIKKAAAAKRKEAEKRKEKSIEKATEIIMEEMLKESGIHGSSCLDWIPTIFKIFFCA